MIGQLPWTPLLCSACGRVLEEWRWPHEEGCYVLCSPCGIPHVRTSFGLAPVAWDDLAPELAAVMREVMRHHWAERIAVSRAYLRAA